jgi:hypothetical protein
MPLMAHIESKVESSRCPIAQIVLTLAALASSGGSFVQ